MTGFIGALRSEATEATPAEWIALRLGRRCATRLGCAGDDRVAFVQTFDDFREDTVADAGLDLNRLQLWISVSSRVFGGQRVNCAHRLALARRTPAAKTSAWPAAAFAATSTPASLSSAT